MRDHLWQCPQCGRTSSQPPNVTAVTCMNRYEHTPSRPVEMEEQNVEDED